ncbi:MAG: Hsp20/alpha crystallin family protein [Gammaproteobacteria bacterium]|nr:Hsp20/alpha crystallin family protein [Gammaproteobacteria bacterium]
MKNLLKERNESNLNKTSSARSLSPFDEIERMFENFSTKGWLRPFHWDMPAISDITAPLERKIPNIDVIDHDEEIIVKAEMPGIEKKDLDISISNNNLIIKGSSSHEEKEERDDYYHCEISKGSYMRTVALPAEVNEGKIKAKFNNGMLEVSLPKVEKTKKQSIKID